MKNIVLSMLVASSLFAGSCKYDVKNIDVDFEAYKTPLRIGVKGSFHNIILKAYSAKSQQELLQSATVAIDINKIYTKNLARDKKIIEFFFGRQNITSIEAKVLSVKKDVVEIALTMNGVTKTVPMNLESDDEEIDASGHIDLADFNMLPALAGITKACYDKHQGKTWQDVEIEFEIKTKKTCN